MTKIETEGYMGSYGTKSFQRVSKEFIEKILTKYCGKDKRICSLGCYNDVLIDQIDFSWLFLVDKEFGECKYREEPETNIVMFNTKEEPTLYDKFVRYVEEPIEDFVCDYNNNGFDVVIMTNVAEHLTIIELINILQNIKNILRDGGIFIITYPNAQSVNRLVGTVMGILSTPFTLGEHDRKLGHKNMMCMKSIKEIQEILGMSLEEEIGIYFKPLSHSQMDEYFGDVLDRFIDIGYDLGPEVCSYVGGVFKK